MDFPSLLSLFGKGRKQSTLEQKRRPLTHDARTHPFVELLEDRTGAVQRDSLANTLPDRLGNQQPRAIYVAWNTDFTEPKYSAPAMLSRVWVSASDDSGFDVTTPQCASDRGSPATAPQIAFTQGPSDGRVPGGQLLFFWNGSVSSTNLLFNQMAINASSPDGGSATTTATVSNGAVTAITISNGIRHFLKEPGYSVGEKRSALSGTVS